MFCFTAVTQLCKWFRTGFKSGVTAVYITSCGFQSKGSESIHMSRDCSMMDMDGYKYILVTSIYILVTLAPGRIVL